MKAKILLLVLSMFVLGGISQAQCPGCVVDMGCPTAIPNGGICQDTLPWGMASAPYDEDVSFHMPATFVDGGTGYTIHLRNIEITGFSGLPLGVDATSDQTNYNPQAGENLGCVKFCGTPLAPGTYDITVYITADVTATGTPIGDVDVTQNETYETELVVLPDTNGGVASFTYTPFTTKACDVLDVTFEGTIDGAPNPTHWGWWINGVSHTLQNPPSQSWNTPGEYNVELTTIIYDYVITKIRIDGVHDNWSGDVEETIAALFSPDLYVILPSLGFMNRGSASGSTSATFNGLNIPIPTGTTSFNLEIWDEDTGPPLGTNPLGSADDLCGTVSINVGLGTVLFNDGTGNVGYVEFDTVRSSVFVDSLTFTVYDSPVGLNVHIDNDTICAGDTTMIALSLDTGDHLGNYIVEWYNDSVLIPSASDTFYAATAAGNYWARIIDPVSLCETQSGAKQVWKGVSPPSIVAITPIPGQLVNSNLPASGFGIQWYYNGSPIPGENGQFLTYTATGNYQAYVYNLNYPQCSNISDEYYVEVNTGIADVPADNIVNLHAFPNPNNGSFQITFGVSVAQNVKVSLTDMLGRELQADELQNFSGDYSKLIDLQDAEAGVYFVNVQGEYSSLTKKIVIQ